MGRIKNSAAKKAAKEISFADAFERFLTDRAARGLTEKTLTTYKSHLHCVSLHFDISMPLSSLTRDSLNAMVVSMRAAGLSSNTIVSYTRVITTFLHWCREESLCDVEMSKYKMEETVKETYTDEELDALLKRPAPNCRFSVYRTWVIINFFMNAGSRAATVRHIKIGDVDLNSQQIVSRHNKNGKIHVIPLCRQMVAILREYMEIRGGDADDYLFCDEFGNQFSENGLRLAVARYNKSRGVDKTSIHLFRHTFARKYLVDCGGNAFTLQKLLNHSTLKMTKHYCTIFDADIAKNYDTLSPLAQMKANNARIKRK